MNNSGVWSVLGVSVSVVDDENSLNEVLDRLKGKKLVLIDTAGLNQNCKDWQTQVEEFINANMKSNTTWFCQRPVSSRFSNPLFMHTVVWG